MIPQEKSEAVTRGLREAFGVSAADEISVVTGGHTSSRVFRVVARGTPYLMKIITRAEDPSRHYECMRTAAEAGVAPKVWHTDAESKISITDFVKATTLRAEAAVVPVAAMLRTLHQVRPFGRAPFNTTCTYLLDRGPLSTGPSAEGFLQKFRASNLLPAGECEEFFRRYAELAAVYPYGDSEMVSCHNDVFNPGNVLFDGRRVWLVDWEAAFLNDRYADLAVAANYVVGNEEEEEIFLREYFGGPSSEYQRARFHLMQQISHLFYTMGLLYLGSAGRVVDREAAVPEFREYHRQMWAGEVDLGDKDVKVLHGRAHWARFLDNVQQPRYGEALRLMAERRASREA